MDTVFYILSAIAFLCFLCIIYFLYQLKRNAHVYEIRIRWLRTDDNRLDKYTDEEMLNPSIKNYFGLTIRKDKDFK